MGEMRAQLKNHAIAQLRKNKQNKQTNTHRGRGGSCEAQLYTYEDMIITLHMSVIMHCIFDYICYLFYLE